MNGGLQVLRLELRSDRDAFAARSDELAGLSLSASTGDANLLARAAVALHHAYGAFESALARIARVFDTEPSGANWHRSLLETMAMDVPGIRPAVVGPQTLPAMRDLPAFRHFFRHAYTVPLDARRLTTLRDLAVRVRPSVVADFTSVDGWLAGLSDRV